MLAVVFVTISVTSRIARSFLVERRSPAMNQARNSKACDAKLVLRTHTAVCDLQRSCLPASERKSKAKALRINTAKGATAGRRAPTYQRVRMSFVFSDFRTVHHERDI